jgi:hypothetical protein
MTHVISVLNNVFHLHIKYAKLSSQVSQCLILSTSHNVRILKPKKLLMLTNSIMLTVSRHNTLRSLGMEFRPFTNSVRDT